MEIFNYFFSIIKQAFEVYDVDFFGLGFTYLDFVLASFLIVALLSFLFKGMNVMDKFNFSSMLPNRSSNNSMSNSKREEQILSNYSLNYNTPYAPAGFIDVYGDGTYVIPESMYYGRK